MTLVCHRSYFFKVFVVGIVLVFSGALWGEADQQGRVPDEYESDGGHGLGFGLGGVAAVSDLSSRVCIDPVSGNLQK